MKSCARLPDAVPSPHSPPLRRAKVFDTNNDIVIPMATVALAPLVASVFLSSLFPRLPCAHTWARISCRLVVLLFLCAKLPVFSLFPQ